MKDFAELIKRLESTNKTNAKLEAIISYLETAADDDKLWFIALFTGKRPKRTKRKCLWQRKRRIKRKRVWSNESLRSKKQKAKY